MTRNKKHNAYKEANEAFLQVKAQEEGMVVLDNGVLYKVLEAASFMSTTPAGSSTAPSSTPPRGSHCRRFSWWGTSSWAGRLP